MGFLLFEVGVVEVESLEGRAQSPALLCVAPLFQARGLPENTSLPSNQERTS